LTGVGLFGGWSSSLEFAAQFSVCSVNSLVQFWSKLIVFRLIQRFSNSGLPTTSGMPGVAKQYVKNSRKFIFSLSLCPPFCEKYFYIHHALLCLELFYVFNFMRIIFF